MAFKIGLLLVLLLIIGEIEEVRISIERLNKTIRRISIQEEAKDDDKDPNSMQEQKK